MAKPAGSNQVRTAFAKLWRLSGEPALQIIPAISEWSLPAEVVYDRHVDQFVDASGAPVVVDWRTQPTTEVHFLPRSDSHNAALRMLGLTVTDGVNVAILWDEMVCALVKEAWGVLLSDRLYRIESWQTIPPGVSGPTMINLSLAEGD